MKFDELVESVLTEGYKPVKGMKVKFTHVDRAKHVRELSLGSVYIINDVKKAGGATVVEIQGDDGEYNLWSPDSFTPVK